LRELREGTTEVGEFLRENWSISAVSDIANELVRSAIENTFTADPPQNGFILDGALKNGDGTREVITLFARPLPPHTTYNNAVS